MSRLSAARECWTTASIAGVVDTSSDELIHAWPASANPLAKTHAVWITNDGKDLYATDPTLCCHMRKVVPLQETLAGYPAWVTGLKRVDAPSRAHTPVLEIDKAGRLKINPIITWTDDDVENYIVEHDLIRHPLTTQGYPSIGCETCTARVQAGEDPRSGRWQGKEKTECGLHV